MPGIRNCIIPPEGWVIMEGDFTQAELFVLAGLSQDKNMWRVLTTPGMDLHTKTALDAFNIKMFKLDGSPFVEEELLTLAAAFYKSRGGGTTTFDKSGYETDLDKMWDTITFVDGKGTSMSYKTLKGSYRVSSKALSFGIAYGRQSESLAIQVLIESGSADPLSKLIQDMETGLRVWKTQSYPTAWAYLEEASWEGMNLFEVKNPWGRSRRFIPTTNRRLLAGYGRQSANYKIQSTVADTCNLALQRMLEERPKRNLGFRVCNLVHDAIMTLVPIPEIEATKQLYRDTMGSIKIPLKDREPLVLGVDIEVMSRWGVAYKG